MSHIDDTADIRSARLGAIAAVAAISKDIADHLYDGTPLRVPGPPTRVDMTGHIAGPSSDGEPGDWCQCCGQSWPCLTRYVADIETAALETVTP